MKSGGADPIAHRERADGATPKHERARTGRAAIPERLAQLATLEVAEVLRQLATSEHGLSAAEVERRLEEWGENRIAHERREALALQVLKRLANPLNLLLLALAAVSMVMGDHRAALIIFVMVILSLTLATVQERRSSRAAERLRAMVHTTAAVIREAGEAASPASPEQAIEVPIEELVPGDIVHLSAGDMIPADLRLMAAKDLFVNQASLTGESLPVEKHAAPCPSRGAGIGAMSNICFMGTTVVSGSATGVIALTGRRAYFGSLAETIVGERVPTSFDRGVNRFAWLMIRFILVMAPLVFLINGLTKGDWVQALLFATAVAVGLTPEMLPMIVTVNLAKGAIAMSRRKVVVKRLSAIQNFGAMDVLCTDKTGTLTEDRVILQKALDLEGGDSREVLEYAYLNSYYQSGLKNLLDVAVLRHEQARSLEAVARVYHKFDEVPFDFERRRMSVAVEGGGRRLLICKGAVEEVFAASSHGRAGGESFALDDSHLASLRRSVDELNADGFRVIAVAVKELPASQSACGLSDESDLLLVGYIAFLDPPKASAARAIAALAKHGVAVKVLTGDNEAITRKICREVGLTADRIVSGAELEGLSDVELAALIERTQVFARVSPTQKAAVIAGLQRNGHVVGFLGDGINDGPALKSADVGISVDSAVDIAKESADLILLEKSLLVLDDGVMEGRKVFGNVVKYIRMGASSNFGNMFSVIGASAWLPFLPMSPVQVLTNNLLYDLSQTAIPTDGVDEEYLERPRRWEIGNIGRFVLTVGPISSLFDYATYGTMYFLFGARTPAQAALFQTGWFVESIISQTLIIHVIRTRRLAFIESRASAPLMLTSLGVCAVGAILPYSPFAGALGFVPLPPLFWPILALMVLAYLALTHVMKVWFHRRFGLD
ncbi:MAG TPA: magnesium-translocating P-type ATPase [Steroidobacteraceae bacterium]|nr:magnesium-translocating P-type ATPase [Steroidobacteraceae bacterium]